MLARAARGEGVAVAKGPRQPKLKAISVGVMGLAKAYAVVVFVVGFKA